MSNYIVRETGYTALLSAIIEMAERDAAKTDKQGRPTSDALDAMAGLKEWRDEITEGVHELFL